LIKPEKQVKPAT